MCRQLTDLLVHQYVTQSRFIVGNNEQIEKSVVIKKKLGLFDTHFHNG